jgi:prepilin-type N-terminal cleavage/methylation domain-containing protein
MMKRSCTSHGFTLIEVIIAIFILIVAFAGIFAVTSMVINGNALGREITTATTITQNKLEELKKTPYANLAGGSRTESIYSTRWTVTANSPQTNMSRLDAVTSWERSGKTHNVTLKLIVAR